MPDSFTHQELAHWQTKRSTQDSRKSFGLVMTARGASLSRCWHPRHHIDAVNLN
jgi:hypothetical protein